MMETFLFLLLWVGVIAWYFFTLAYIIPQMPRYWNKRAVWLFIAAFMPVLIPVELWLQRPQREYAPKPYCTPARKVAHGYATSWKTTQWGER